MREAAGPIAAPRTDGYVTAPAMASITRRWGLVLTLVAALGLLLAHLLSSISAVRILISYPFGVDYGEGIVWQQMRNIIRGDGYAPLGVYPAIVYHYPPIFHLSAAVTARLFHMDELAAGRAVSWTATLATAVAIGPLANAIAGSIRDRLAIVVGTLLLGLTFLSCGPVEEWGALMRVDMLAYPFSVAGLWLALRSLERTRLVHAAAFFFTLAIYTKQVSIAAPAAAFLGLLAVRPRLAWKLTIYTLAQSGAVLALLQWLTSGNFLRHVILYNVNRFSLDPLIWLVDPLLLHIIYIALACAGAGILLRRLRLLWPERKDHETAVAGAIMGVVYFGLKTIMIAMILKSGSSINYIIEWLISVVILCGVVVLPAVEAATTAFRAGTVPPGRSTALVASILVAVAFQAWLLPHTSVTRAQADVSRKEAERVVELIRHTPGPVISDDMTLLIRADRQVSWEPSIAAELGAKGRYNEAAFVRLVQERRFGLFVTEGDRGDRVYDSRYNPAVAQAIDDQYSRKYQLARFTIHAPRD